MASIFERVSAMTADKRDALNQQFDKASRIATAAVPTVATRVIHAPEAAE